jgi:hypothetical protein
MTLTREAITRSVFDRVDLSKAGSARAVEATFEFRNRLPLSEFGYLEGRCIHFGGAMPYLLILDILRDSCGSIRLSPCS